MTPAYLKESEIAALFGRRRTWWTSRRTEFEALGFPKRDPIVGLTLKADVDEWIARRRVLGQRDLARFADHHTESPQPRENLGRL